MSQASEQTTASEGQETRDAVAHHYGLARDLALAEVERLARQIMREGHAHEFVMAMGVWSFSDRLGQNVSHEIRSNTTNYVAVYAPLPWAQALTDFIDEWDEYLKLTGEPMRFTAEGEVCRDW